MEATLPFDGARKLPYLLSRASKHTGSEFAFFQVAKINKETCRYIGIQKYPLFGNIYKKSNYL